MHIQIHTQSPYKALGDLFGVFFEDLNHAADGGLYAEMVQNRSFEFDPLDHPDYHALTAWEAVGQARLEIKKDAPLNENNVHYLRLSGEKGDGVMNAGFGAGMALKKDAGYAFSMFARAQKPVWLRLFVGENDCGSLMVSGGWRKYELVFEAKQTEVSAKLSLVLDKVSEVDVDMVSLFPGDTFMGRPNGLRKDIAQAIADMKPKFLRFPGGCLVHDGQLDQSARDGIYCWKNTVGPVEARPARRNGWRYNQTFGLGFYEYFLFCEDIGAKPLPVVSGGCDPHHFRFAEGALLQSFIDDALDLIAFANEPKDTGWGKVRADMGHPEPFHLEYIAVGNEEVHQAFYDRLPLFAKAIRQRYPDIKIIGSAGPFAAGGEFERGWQSAREIRVDLVDEHYYQAPQWYIANARRYEAYDASGPKVFLGEYASWGNTYENALCEAAYMTGLQNAPAVGLACYAPMLCHADYVNWKPDMIWFDNHRVMKTPNYHVQSLFMRRQGENALKMTCGECAAQRPEKEPEIVGALSFLGDDSTLQLTDIVLNGEKLDNITISGREKILLKPEAGAFVLECKARRLAGKKGMKIIFGQTDDANDFGWGFGGWENQDSIINARVNGRGSCLTQSAFSIQAGRVYALKLAVEGRRIRTWIDSELMNDTEDKLPYAEQLYLAASEENGSIILKAVNVREEAVQAHIGLNGSWRGSIETLAGKALTAENQLGQEDQFCPKTDTIQTNGAFEYTFPPHSITVMLLDRKG